MMGMNNPLMAILFKEMLKTDTRPAQPQPQPQQSDSTVELMKMMMQMQQQYQQTIMELQQRQQELQMQQLMNEIKPYLSRPDPIEEIKRARELLEGFNVGSTGQMDETTAKVTLQKLEMEKELQLKQLELEREERLRRMEAERKNDEDENLKTILQLINNLGGNILSKLSTSVQNPKNITSRGVSEQDDEFGNAVSDRVNSLLEQFKKRKKKEEDDE